MDSALAPRRVAALDLGSGTIKLSIFETGPRGYQALCLDEVNTELRKGMGRELRLQVEPIASTLAACAVFVKKARSFGIETVSAYGTSALRKAVNAQDLLAPLLRRLDVTTKILNVDDEGRLNLLGVLARDPGSRALVLDPGGDSSELCGGPDWRTAPVASLPFGSVSLQETYGSASDNSSIAWKKLERVAAETKDLVQSFGPAKVFIGQRLLPAIRINLPIQRTLEQVNGLPVAEHGQGGLYTYRHLEVLTQAMAATDHAGRATLMAGEPLGKVDRSCYGFASWLGVLQALDAHEFRAEPWGIKLGAAIALNGVI